MLLLHEKVCWKSVCDFASADIVIGISSQLFVQANGSLHSSTPPSARRRRQREAANGAAAHIDIGVAAREPLLLSWEDICCTVPAPASPGGIRRILQARHWGCYMPGFETLPPGI